MYFSTITRGMQNAHPEEYILSMRITFSSTKLANFQKNSRDQYVAIRLQAAQYFWKLVYISSFLFIL